MDVNPQFAGALAQLGILLDDYHYSAHAKGRILAWTALHGTPALCPELDLEDEADAELVFVASLPEVPFDSPAWGEPDEATLIAGEAPDGPAVAAKMVAQGTLPPVSGGCPDEPYEPTEEDWAELRRWSEWCDARDRATRSEPMFGYE
jgi:hypothetical protein